MIYSFQIVKVGCLRVFCQMDTIHRVRSVMIFCVPMNLWWSVSLIIFDVGLEYNSGWSNTSRLQCTRTSSIIYSSCSWWSYNDFKSYEETAYLMSSPKNAERLNKSIAEVETGKYLQHGVIEEWFFLGLKIAGRTISIGRLLIKKFLKELIL